MSKWNGPAHTQTYIHRWPKTDADRSWWVDLPRDVFTQYAASETPRMLRNKESILVGGFTLEKMASPLPSKDVRVSLERGQ